MGYLARTKGTKRSGLWETFIVTSYGEEVLKTDLTFEQVVAEMYRQMKDSVNA